MNNNCIQSATYKGEDDKLKNIEDESQTIETDSMISNHNEMMAQLTTEIEIQQATINTLSSEIIEMKSI
jgi:hypothetical protein